MKKTCVICGKPVKGPWIFKADFYVCGLPHYRSLKKLKTRYIKGN